MTDEKKPIPNAEAIVSKAFTLFAKARRRFTTAEVVRDIGAFASEEDVKGALEEHPTVFEFAKDGWTLVNHAEPAFK